MKGKLYYYNKATGKMEQVDAEFTLPAPVPIPSERVIITGKQVLELSAKNPKDFMHKLLDMADETAEELPRQRCVEEQNRIQELRERWLGQ